MKNKHKKRTIKHKLALIIFIIGILTLSYEPLTNLYIKKTTDEAFEQEVKPLKKVVTEEIEAEEEIKEVETTIDPNLPQDTYYDMDNKQLNIGKLSIPSVDLKLAIIKGVGQDEGDPMEKGAATNKEGQEMGLRNYVLASHAMKNPTLLFSPLFNVNFEDEIYVTDENKVYVYEVSGIDTVEPERVDILDDVEGRQMLTLYTCTQAGSKRLVVTADLVDTLDFNEETKLYFN